MRSFLGIFKQSFNLSRENIRSNKMRTFLTTLGITIGVMAVIALITIVNGVINNVMEQFAGLGAGTLSVTATGTPLKKGMTEKDMENIAALDNVAGLTPKLSIQTSGAGNNKFLKKVSLTGVSADYYYYNNELVTLGRAISKSDVDNEAYVCVINEEMADGLFPGENPIGKQVVLSGATFTVIGMEGKTDSLMAAMSDMGSDYDGEATIPYTIAKKITGVNKITSIEIYIEDTDYTDELSTQVKNVLYQAFNQRDDAYYVFSMDSLMDTMNSMMSTLSYMLAGIASIALLVGGIGIMNMMLVSVTERTKEIGLRKAMGATPFRIQLQFLIESIMLSLYGGIIGVVLGLAVSIIVSALLKVDFAFSGSAVALGVGFSTAVGIIFGWAPAKKASSLSPIDALRSE